MITLSKELVQAIYNVLNELPSKTVRPILNTLDVELKKNQEEAQKKAKEVKK